MKSWIITKITGTGTDEDPIRPYLADQDTVSSMMELPDGKYLCRVAGTPSQIVTILSDQDITELTDEQAKNLIHSKHPDSDIENIDVADPEIDEIAKTIGLDPHLRADIKTPSRGKQVLQDQENYLMTHISMKKGRSKQFWDDEAAKSGVHHKGIDIENAIIDGKADAHEFVLSRLREKI